MAEQPTPTGRLASLGIRRARRIVTTPDGVRWTVRRRLFREPTLVTRAIETAGDPGRWTRAGEVGVGSGLAVVEGAGAMQLVVTPLTTLLFPLLVTLEVALHLVGLQLALPVCRIQARRDGDPRKLRWDVRGWFESARCVDRIAGELAAGEHPSLPFATRVS